MKIELTEIKRTEMVLIDGSDSVKYSAVYKDKRLLHRTGGIKNHLTMKEWIELAELQIKNTMLKILEYKNTSVQFAEYVAENHYRLVNVEGDYYYWKSENDEKTTQELYDEFEKQN